MTDASANELRLSIDKLACLLEKQATQRTDVLQQWQKANPQRAARCKKAAVVLSDAYNELIDEILEAAEDRDACLNPFTMHEFLDKYGPKIAHFGNMIQILSQLGG